MKKIQMLLLLILFLFFRSSASITLPKIIADNMVLQRGQPLSIWGWASPSEKVMLSIGTQHKSTVAGKDGKWILKLDVMQAGGPYQLTIKGKNTIVINNVLVGEVWVCSGQSNMEMPIAGWGKIDNYENEIRQADYPEIRQFRVGKTIGAFPQNDIAEGAWDVCSPQTAGDFSATAYFYAREIYKSLHVPVGIINASWGGSMIETWISRKSFENSDEFREMISGITARQIDDQLKDKNERLKKSLEKLRAGSAGQKDIKKWQEESLDDSRWPQMKLPGMWELEKMGLEDLDGWVCFRKTIVIDDSDLGKPATIHFGHIDDYGEVYINGNKIGDTKNIGSENTFLKLCPGILKAGKNIISLRIQDIGGYGGIYAKDEDLFIDIGNKPISIAGAWLFQVEQPLNQGNPNSYPTLLFNTMISPLIPYGIKGVIWYQGETNASRAFQYRKAFPLLINDWRDHWNLGAFPFYFVQLASFDASGGSAWAELREAQTMTLGLPNTGMAVTVDIGDSRDIHPRNKQDVGKRLAAVALAKTYGKSQEYSGPQYSSMQTEGDHIILRFSHMAKGFSVNNKYGYLKGFQIAGDDSVFHWAKAYVKADEIIVYADEVSRPIAIRYGWEDDAGETNLFNKEGLPAIPFRTDSWPGITNNIKYKVQ